VRSTRDRSQHGQALGRDLDAVFAEKAGRVARHGCFIDQIVDRVKSWPGSTSRLIEHLIITARAGYEDRFRFVGCSHFHARALCLSWLPEGDVLTVFVRAHEHVPETLSD